VASTAPFDLDEEFYASCLAISEKLGNQSPMSPAETPASPTAYTFGELDLNEGDKGDMVKDIVVPHSSRLTDRYRRSLCMRRGDPAAYKDFFGTPSGAPCIYKTDPAWREPTGPQAQRIIREARPVYGHAIGGTWPKIGADIYQLLDSRGVKWISIDPVAFAEASEKTPFCPLLIWIGVKYETLLFDAAVAAADAIKQSQSSRLPRDRARFPRVGHQ